jgi:outer membrane protein OmpA-like peptidoglycan-associated protein
VHVVESFDRAWTVIQLMEDRVEKKFLSSYFARTFGAGALMALAACGGSTTSQLTDARRAYDEAEQSPARTRAPGDLAEARAALDRAEAAHDDEPGSTREARLAERAERKARAAEAHGEAISERRVAVGAKTDTRRADEPSAVAPERRTRTDRRSAREANGALQSLASVANVKEDPRGVVITLSGGLLFPSGERDVSPIANRSMDQVAHALAQQPDDTTFEVDGYTDNTGSENENQRLSAQRAQAVADRLTHEGIDASRIKVEGRGEAQPIADNSTADGRTANRRVEILVVHH